MQPNTELLRTIQDGAVSTAVPVGDLLRRCQVLAARLAVPELGAWVRHELNGYPNDVTLPDYRVLHGLAMGHFTGPFGSGIRNAILPANNLPKGLRHWTSTALFRQPIAALEEIARNPKQDHIRCAWPGDLVALVQQDFYEQLVLAQAWLSISRPDIVGAVETVRNRILTFALEVEHLVKPDDPDDVRQTGGTLSHVFHTIVYGNVGNIAQASTNVTQNSGVAAGDLESLLREVSGLGVLPEDADELRTAVSEDGPAKNGKFGTRVAGWVGGIDRKSVV